MKTVSVIVPAYNVENYLPRCLDSLVAQTLPDIEVLLVDDGSTDATAAIARDYAARYPALVRVFTVENGGAAAARNRALSAAAGEYIGFVDSDDSVCPAMFERLYDAARQKQADIVCCDHLRVMTTGTDRRTFADGRVPAGDVFDKSVYESPLLFDESPYLWNKLFSAALIRDHGLRFEQDLRIYEDLLFTYSAFAFAKRISRVDEPLYAYDATREGSLTHAFTERRFDLFAAADRLLAVYQTAGRLDESVRRGLEYLVLKHVYVVLAHPTAPGEKALKRRFCDQAFAYLDRQFPAWRDSDYFSLRDKPRRAYTSRRYWYRQIALGREISLQTIRRRINRRFSTKKERLP
ncbi:MAG: glycosyltransferase [Acutalibacteraceae bacterium]|jgi:CDP-glycerol glycerophosphotransferase